ncbi:ribosome-binding factor A [Synechococcus sp. PCC 6312]|nr:ribosome-binding factor A [Synechococcus sp. PCC 6312]
MIPKLSQTATPSPATQLDKIEKVQAPIQEKIMAPPRRVERVAELIRREVSQLLVHNIKDERVGNGMVSVTDVIVSGDLQHAKIFVSIYGTDEVRTATMAGLKAATGYVRSEIGQRVRLRRTPEIVFVEDRSLERGTKVLSLLNDLERNRPPESLESAESEVPLQ